MGANRSAKTERNGRVMRDWIVPVVVLTLAGAGCAAVQARPPSALTDEEARALIDRPKHDSVAALVEAATDVRVLAAAGWAVNNGTVFRDSLLSSESAERGLRYLTSGGLGEVATESAKRVLERLRVLLTGARTVDSQLVAEELKATRAELRARVETLLVRLDADREHATWAWRKQRDAIDNLLAVQLLAAGDLSGGSERVRVARGRCEEAARRTLRASSAERETVREILDLVGVRASRVGGLACEARGAAK